MKEEQMKLHKIFDWNHNSQKNGYYKLKIYKSILNIK